MRTMDWIISVLVLSFIQPQTIYCSNGESLISSNNPSIPRSSKLNTLDAGIQPIQAEQTLVSADQQTNLRKGHKHLVVVTTEMPPFLMSRRVNLADSSDNHSKLINLSIKAIPERDRTGNLTKFEWYGYCIDFFEELIKHLPYEVSYELYRSPDGKFGSKTREVALEKDEKTGKVIGRREIERWGGIVGELAEKRADIALAPLSVMAERELVIDFTVPFYDLVGIQILIKKPEVSKDWFKFLTVLDNDVWLSIFVAYFITSVVIYLFDRLSPYSHQNAERIKRLRQDRQKRASTLLSNRGESQFSARPTADADNLTKSQRPLLAAVHESQPIRLFDQTNAYLEDTNPQHRLSMAKMTHGSSLANRWRRLSHEFNLTLGYLNQRNAASLERVDDIVIPPQVASGGHIDATEVGIDQNTSDVHGESHDDDLQRPKFDLHDSFWFCITSLTPQGGGEAPQNLSGRVVAGAWWLFCFIVIASYTANLAAFLTVSRLDIPIESLDDLAKQYRIRYAPMDGTSEHTYFERMAYIEEIFYNIWKEMSLNDSLSESERSKFAVWEYPISDKYTKIWSQIQEVGMPSGAAEALMRVKNSTLDDGFALLADANLVKYATMTDCSFKAIGDEFSRKPIALGVAKGQEKLRDDLSYAILKLINQRFMEVLREKWWTNNEARITCADSSDESGEGMSIENIGGVFIIILTGVVLSFIVWAIERFIYQSKIDISRDIIQSGTSQPSKT